MTSRGVAEGTPTHRLSRRGFVAASTGLALGTAGCAAAPPTAGTDGASWDRLPLRVQVDRVRAATERFSETAVARDAGFTPVKLAEVCTVEFHRRDGWETDRTVDPLQPNGLVYAVDAESRRLVAVAYLRPVHGREPGTPPDLFNDETGSEELVEGYGETHIWEAVPDETGVHEGLVWQLLAWVHERNPQGVFNSYNPNYPQSLGDTDCTG